MNFSSNESANFEWRTSKLLNSVSCWLNERVDVNHLMSRSIWRSSNNADICSLRVSEGTAEVFYLNESNIKEVIKFKRRAKSSCSAHPVLPPIFRRFYAFIVSTDMHVFKGFNTRWGFLICLHRPKTGRRGRIKVNTGSSVFGFPQTLAEAPFCSGQLHRVPQYTTFITSQNPFTWLSSWPNN